MGFDLPMLDLDILKSPTFVIDTPSQKRTATGKVSYDTSGVGTITAVEVIDPGFGYTMDFQQ